jgi:iron complex outermembrane receptor protein
MKKVVLTLGLLSSLTAWSQTTVLDTATVSASLNQQSLISANRSVIVLDQEQLKTIPAQSISDVLDFAVGVDARQRGPFDTQTDLSIRGSSFEQVLVLVNGVRMSDPQTGHHLMNLPVAKEDIERIEILMGGSSPVFGSGAFAGSINIITKKAQQNSATFSASAGSNESYQVGFNQQLAGENYQTNIGVQTAAHEGFMYNTDAENHNFYVQHMHALGNEQLQVAAGYNRKAFGAQSFYSTTYPEQFERTSTLFASIGLSRNSEKSSLKREVFWRRNWDEFQLYREGDDFYQYDNGLFIKGNDTAASFYAGHNYHRSDVVGGKLSSSMQSVLGRSAVMAEYRLENIVSNNLGTALEAPIAIQGKRGSYTLGAHRTNISIALEHEVRFGALTANGALLYNYNTDYPDQNFYPSLSVGYVLNNQNRLFFNANRSFRLPSYTDLYYRLGGAVGSAGLQPENSVNLELGYKYTRGKHFAQAAAFRRMGQNLIDWVSYPDSNGLFASNITQVNLNGLDLSYRYAGIDLGFGQLDFVQLGFSYYQADEDSTVEFQSLYVLDYLNYKATLSTQITFWDRLHIAPAISLQQRNGTYTDRSGQEVAYESIALVNLRMAYTLSQKAEVFVYGTNLLDTPYVDRGNVTLPGAWLWGGFKLTL